MLRGILAVLSGAIVSQAIGIGALPLLARLYSPEAFGALQIYMSAIGVLMMFTTLRYEVAILLPEDRTELAHLVWLCVVLNVALTPLLALLVWAWTRSGIPGAALDTLWYWLLPPAFLVGGLLQTWTYLPIRLRDYPASARAKLAQTLGYVSAAGLLGLFNPSSLGLIVSDIAGRTLSLASIARLTPSEALHGRRPRLADLVRTARRFEHYPLFVFPSTLLSAANAALVPYLVFWLFGLASAGQYALVDRSIGLAAGMLGAALSQVFTGEFAERLRAADGSANRLFRRTVGVLAAISIGPVLLVAIFAPQLFGVVFGAQWALAGELARIMVFVAMTSFVTAPVNMVLLLCSRQRLQLAWQAANFVTSVLVWGLVYLLEYHDLLWAIGLYAACAILLNLVFLVMADRVSATAPGNLAGQRAPTDHNQRPNPS